ncbi:MAG: 4-hydroxy-tetrahydrodipicolinate reductase [Nitrospiraceae bacterium]|nr:4-hydroxy-tetrahydrodipicolinate reductase [Nitrospiraceae bacterium]
MVKIAVAGAMGRMGSRIAALSAEYENIRLAGALERKGHPDTGKEFFISGPAGQGNPPPVRLSDDVFEALAEADVLIDFTQPASTLSNLKACVEAGKAMVIGTTGFTGGQMEEINGLAPRTTVVMAANMSLGINLLLKIVRTMAEALGDDYDVEIIEAHHRFKKDAPSGTALKLAQAAAVGLKRNLDDVAVYARHGMTGERPSRAIGIQTVRAGDIVGEHTVLFGGLGERIEVTHKASSRDTFARGALRAALWLQDKGPGLYDMQDVLGLK